MTNLQPVVFFGHGNPMNALSRNRYTEAWAAIGAGLLVKPKAVVCISAHWYLRGSTAVTVSTSPRTIHDFRGFPPELNAIQYPAPGDPALARRIQTLLTPVRCEVDDGAWGLDHGTWSVLIHTFPNADVPVVQLSIDATQPPQFHYDLGRRLAPLREEGVLVTGSGNIVHNLRTYAWGQQNPPAYTWAATIEDRAKELLLSASHRPLIDYADGLGAEGRLAIPTPDHYLPLLYTMGAAGVDAKVTFPVDGIEGGSISMLAAQFH
ncbi:dioxygenase [Bryobacterales bacterium F-183]|nr:dioxygenase [Bryobacterales bacterium F-183]